MTTLPYSADVDPSEMRRWSLSAGFVVGIHLLLIVVLVYGFTRPPVADGTGQQPVMIDLETVTPTPDAQKQELPPGELMTQAPPPTPEPEVEKQAVEKEEIAPTPMQDKPVVVAPPEQKEKPKPVKEKTKPVVKKPPVNSIAAPRTSAPAVASIAARASYRGMVSAHLQRFKNPAAASAAGVASVSFTLSRSGQLLGSRLSGSSGSPALDAEAMAMVRRAQPYPAFLPDMPESSMAFSVPVRFTQR